MEDITLLLLGILLSVIGLVTMTGNISTIHPYNRRNVREEEIPKYGKAVGIGILVIGAALIADYILILLDLEIADPYVLLLGTVAGLALILYAQFKYNRELF